MVCASSMREINRSCNPLSTAVVPGFPKKIGGVEAANPIWLAPMAGITFGSVRLFFRRLGAALVHTEMVSALGLCHKGRKTKELLGGSEEERPVVLQLFGADADSVAKGAEIALGIRRYEALQVNMACPMPKVTKKGSGAKLMENPEEAARMVAALKSAGLPVWAKIRIMPEKSAISTADFCDKLLEAGCDYLHVHGRTPAQRYEGTASRDAVQAVAQKFPGLIGGSGDCYKPEDFIDYLNRGCTSVLAGRGFLRDALLIPRTLKALGADVPPELLTPTIEDQAAILLELGRNIYNTEGQALALMIARRMLAALFKGFPGASQLRRRGALARTWQEMEGILLNWETITAEELAFQKGNFPHGVIEEA